MVANWDKLISLSTFLGCFDWELTLPKLKATKKMSVMTLKSKSSQGHGVYTTF